VKWGVSVSGLLFLECRVSVELHSALHLIDFLSPFLVSLSEEDDSGCREPRLLGRRSSFPFLWMEIEIP